MVQYRFAFVSLSLPLSLKSVTVEQAADFFHTHKYQKRALIGPNTTTHQSWLPVGQRKQSMSCRGRFVQPCLPPFPFCSSQTGAPRRTARKSTLVFIIWFSPLLHHPMETCNAGMSWRCSAHSLVRAESRASSPHPVSWGGAHVLLWSQPSFGLLVSTGDESVGARAGWLNIVVRDAWDPPPPYTPIFWCPPHLPMMHHSGDLDCTAARRLTLMLQILMQRGTLLRQRVMRCSSDDQLWKLWLSLWLLTRIACEQLPREPSVYISVK